LKFNADLTVEAFFIKKVTTYLLYNGSTSLFLWQA